MIEAIHELTLIIALDGLSICILLFTIMRAISRSRP